MGERDLVYPRCTHIWGRGPEDPRIGGNHVKAVIRHRPSLGGWSPSPRLVFERWYGISLKPVPPTQLIRSYHVV